MVKELESRQNVITVARKMLDPSKGLGQFSVEIRT
jgi:hypothetical protein